MSFIHILLHLNIYLPEFLNHYGLFAYGLLFLIIFLETGFILTPFLPGDSLLFTLGALLVKTSHDSVFTWIILLISAAFLGDNLNYWLGRCFKKIPKLNPKYLNKTHNFYQKYGIATLILARFVPIVRTFAPFIAGVGKMNYLKFILTSFFAAILWINLLFFLGYFFGNIPWVQNNFSIAIFIIIFISLLPGIISGLKIKLNKKIKQEKLKK